MKVCNNCPRACGVTREGDNIGYCRVGNKPIICRAEPHYWEEPCICGENGSGTVFFGGCNLRCVYCQNAKISCGNSGKEVSESELCDIYLDLQRRGVCNINLVTPTPWTDSIKASLDLAWQKGLYLPTVYNCGGYESVDTLKGLRGYIGIYLPDFKYLSPSLAKKYSHAENYPETAKKALYEMVDQRPSAVYNSENLMVKGVIVRHLVLPSHTEESVEVIEYLHKEYGDSIVLSIMSQYTPMPWAEGELKRTLYEHEYKQVVDHARSIGIKNAYIQDGKSAESSFIPEFNMK